MAAPRFRTIEARLWLYESDSVRKSCDVEEGHALGLGFMRKIDVFTRLQRRMDAAQRTYTPRPQAVTGPRARYRCTC